MVDFNKVNEYIGYVEESTVPEGMSFNEFAMEFFEITKVIPLSKYLRNLGKTSKLPKIMNTKKLGEILIDTNSAGEEIHIFLRRKGFNKVPELDYRVVNLVRKVDLLTNWKKIIAYLSSDKTIAEINSTTKHVLLPGEIEKLENFLMEELNISEEKLNWLISKYKMISENKDLKKSINKLAKQ